MLTFLHFHVKERRSGRSKTLKMPSIYVCTAGKIRNIATNEANMLRARPLSAPIPIPGRIGLWGVAGGGAEIAQALPPAAVGRQA